MIKNITIDGTEYKLEPVEKKELIYNDWRMPTLKELLTLVDYSTHSPASHFDTMSSVYWTATKCVSTISDVWGINFSNGTVNLYDKDEEFYIRYVRDGDNGLEWSQTMSREMDMEEAIELAGKLETSVHCKSKL